MRKEDFLKNLGNPVPSAVLKKYPAGQVFQLWGESPELYSAAFGHNDDLHRYLGGHSGLDIVGAHRCEVVAAHDGTVDHILTSRIQLGGLVVYLMSPPLDGETTGNSKIRTAYAHLDEMVVSVGEWVKKGQRIGYMGNTGFIVSGGTPYWGNAPAGKGTHLHFSLYEYILKNNALVQRHSNPLGGSADPLPYLTGDFSGTTSLLQKALAYLKKLRGY